MLRAFLRTLGCALLFCGFLVAASVDHVPDPPVIQPHAEASHLQDAAACHLPPYAAATVLAAPPPAPRVSRNLLEPATGPAPSNNTDLAASAGDPSPPAF